MARAEDWLGVVGSSGAKASMEVVLGHVDFPVLQTIADEAYADLLDEFQATGMEVVPVDRARCPQRFRK